MSALPINLPSLILTAAQARAELEKFPGLVRNNAMYLRAVDRFERLWKATKTPIPMEEAAKVAAMRRMLADRSQAILEVYQRIREAAVSAATRGKISVNEVPPYAGKPELVYQYFGERITAEAGDGLGALPLIGALLSQAVWIKLITIIVSVVAAAYLISAGIKALGAARAQEAIAPLNAAMQGRIAAMEKNLDPDKVAPLPLPVDPNREPPPTGFERTARWVLWLGAGLGALYLLPHLAASLRIARRPAARVDFVRPPHRKLMGTR